MIYLDYNATTPIDPEVAAAMRPYLEQQYGNPSSLHALGMSAKKAIEKARQQVASLIRAEAYEVIFTSGGTESNNMAIQGVARALRDRGRHIITSSIEHPAVSEVCAYLGENGFEISYLEADGEGRLDPSSLEKAIRPDTILVSIMHANNELGTIQDIPGMASITRKHGILLHTDAAQSTGKIPVDVNELGVDLLSIAGHKIYGPKGIGALYIKSGTPLSKILFGANHEQNLRPGTENVLNIVGLGQACEIAARDMEVNARIMDKTRDHLYDKLQEALPTIRRNGHQAHCLPNTLSISFPGLEANTLVSRLEEVAVSAGAACHADNIDVSAVLTAIKLPVQYAMGTIRFSTGKYTTEAEIDQALDQLLEVVRSLSGPAPGSIEWSGEIKLTHFTHGLGCACKIQPRQLESILKHIKPPSHPNVLVGIGTSDDASVYQISEDTAIVQTLDFFTPIVDDPYDFGAIAAANALSDIYAMGAKPLFAQNIVGFPEHSLPMWVLERILEGAQDKANEAGIDVIGGHTIEDPEPKYGMVVTGSVDPKKYISNGGAEPGDALILTKALGTGILATALKRGLLDESSRLEVTALMSQLNKTAAECMLEFPVHACTDVTGFGLLGHLREMSTASACDVQIYAGAIPVLAKARELAAAGIVPGGSKENLEQLSPWIDFKGIGQVMQLVLADAQTSGGLLIAVERGAQEALVNMLKSNGIPTATVIGHFSRKGSGRIEVLSDQ